MHLGIEKHIQKHNKNNYYVKEKHLMNIELNKNVQMVVS